MSKSARVGLFLAWAGAIEGRVSSMSGPTRWPVRYLAVILVFSLVGGLVPALPAAADPTFDLVASSESNRSWPSPLDQQIVSGDVYVFGTTSETVVDQVSFWVDDPTMTGPADRVDTSAPFDLVGGTPTVAFAWDTTDVSAGEHTVTVKFEYPSLADQTVTATVVVDNILPGIYFTSNPDRTSPWLGVLSGDVYGFVKEEQSIEQVSFWINNEEMTGPADRVDSDAPFDLVGGDEVDAEPFDTTGLANGDHTISVLIEIDGLENKTFTSYHSIWNGIVVDVSWSPTADRSDPELLAWNNFSGDIFVFTQPDDPTIEQVSFWIDDEEMAGAAERVDDEAPFDLAGGDAEEADPFDTSILSPGEHSLTVKIEIEGQEDIVATRWFTTFNNSTPTLVYSTSSDRSSPQLLEGATVVGDIYVFTPPEDVVEVEFWLDDGGSPYRVDDTAPFDLEGNDGASALPFDTTGLSEGRHDLYVTVAVVPYPSYLEAAFFVDNLSTDAVVAGVVFSDMDADGVFDEGTDEPIPDAEVAIFEDDGETPIGTTFTLDSGQYQLAGIVPQDVVVKYDEPSWMVATTPPTVEETLSAGVTTTVDFGAAALHLGGRRHSGGNIDPGYVRTRAGDGDEATVDGGFDVSSFRDMGDVTFDEEGLIYVASEGSIRVVNAASGLTSTLAGHPSSTGCVDDPDPETARFGALSGIGTDGVFLYVADRGCGSGAIRRILRGSGATDTLTSLAGVDELIVGGDGFIYATTGSGLYRVDRNDGTSSLIASASTGFTAVTTINQYVWVVDGEILKSVDLYGDDAVATVADLQTTVTAMEAAGASLYLASGTDGSRILQYNRLTEQVKSVAGTDTPGYEDGTGVDAAFDTVTGIVTDGEANLFIADGENHRIRSMAHDSFFAENGHAFGWDGYGAWAGGINAGLGAYVTSNTDFNIATAGPGLEMTRTYNSLDFYEGPFGVGWSFGYEMSWRRDGEGNVGIIYPDGRREIYEKQIGGEYEPPEGYFSTLEPDGDGFTLTSKDRTVHSFDADGLLVGVTDPNGRTLTLNYVEGKLDVVEDDTSGRTLTFTWDGERISQVATQSVSAHSGTLAWQYYYDGDGRLVEACDPRDNTETTGVCWTYEYSGYHQITKITRPEGNIQAEIDYRIGNGETSVSPIFVGGAGSGSMLGGGFHAAPMIRISFDIVPPDQSPLVWHIRDGEGNATDFDWPMDFQIRTRDPRGFTTIQTYDERFRLISERDPLGKLTTYGYDADGHRDQITDPNGNTVQMTFDERANMTAQTNGEAETTYFEYEVDDLVTRRDGRSTDEADNTYASLYDYDANGNKISETDAEGNERTWEYTDGSESAVGGGTMPAGLLEREISPRGNADGATPADFATVYAYDAEGDLRTVTTPSGLVTEYTHDEIGRVLTVTVTDSVAGTTAVTTTTYDKSGNVLTATAPETADSLSAETHQLRTVNVYDDNSNLMSVTLEDTDGDDPDRVTTFTYDENDRQLSVTDPGEGTLSRIYDKAGNVVRVTDQENRLVVTVYNGRNGPTKVIARSFVDDPVGESEPRHITLTQYGYDAAGRKVSETDAEGNVTRFSYDDADRIVLIRRMDVVDVAEAERDIVLSDRVYDDAGNLLSDTAGDGTANQRTTTHSYDNASRLEVTTIDPEGIDRTTTLLRDENGNVELQTVNEGGRTETVTSVFDESDRLVSRTVENGAVDLETTFGYDERGNQTTITDPRGNLDGATPADYTTTSTYDLAGRLVEVESPEVEIDGGPGTAQPTVSYGYNTFGDRTHTQDPNGNLTISVFDELGRVEEIHHPEYTPPGEVTPINPVELFEYDAVGNLVERTSRRGETTNFVFDNFNRVVQQLDPLLTGEIDRGETRFEYDDVGSKTALVDPLGARTEWTYDRLNRVRTQTVFVHQDVGEPLEFTTAFDHDDLGNQTYMENPEEEVTEQVYNPASELLSVTDPLNEETSFEWELGRQVKSIDPLDRYTVNEYDLAGRLVEVRRYDPLDALLTTTGFGYDAAGNRTDVISPRGLDGVATPADFTTISTFDAGSRLTNVESPVSDIDTITTGYGYDAASNLTVFTDGETNTTTYTYNPWNLREDTVEPSTTAYPDLVDRTWTTIYDAGGLPVEEIVPGEASVTRTFDEMGRLLGETGSGDGSASVTFGYDLVGNRTEISHPDGTIGFEYDDRRLLIEQTGPAGSAGFDYDGAGRLTERVDGSGTHTYNWTARGELDTLVEPLTGTTLDYTWDEASQLSDIAYGTSQAVRSFAYDDLGRLSSDVLADDTPVTVAEVGYDYDLDGNLTERDVTLPGNADAGLNEYGYDNMGRLSSWTFDTTTVEYEWDEAGNRIGVDTDAYVYDQRNRLVSGPGGNYQYSPRGTLTEFDDGLAAVAYSFDPLGRLTAVDTVDYTYDGLGRVADREGVDFAYQGFSLDPVSDGGFTYTRTPGGRLVGVSDGVDDLLVGLDRHGDLTHLFEADGTITDTALYDPYGDPLAPTGGFDPQVGYQGDWTDPTSGHVWMGARWYEGSWAAFLSRDTVFGELSTPMSLNRYTYAYASPLMYWDPLGMYGVGVDGSSSGGSLYTNPKTKAAIKTKTDAQLEKSWMTRANRTTKPASVRSVEAKNVQTVRQSVFDRGHTTRSADNAARTWGMSIPDRPQLWPGGNCPGSGSTWHSCIAQRIIGGEERGCAGGRNAAMCAPPEPEPRTGAGCSTTLELLFSCEAPDLDSVLNGGYTPPQQLPNPCPGAPVGADTHCIDQRAQAGGPYIDRDAGDSGVYVVTGTEGVYVGQSGDIDNRLAQHLRTGRFTAEEIAAAYRITVEGGRTHREIAEQLEIDRLGGISNLLNNRNPIGTPRFGLMPEQPYGRSSV